MQFRTTAQAAAQATAQAAAQATIQPTTGHGPTTAFRRTTAAWQDSGKLLWTVQAALAATFLFTGMTKLVLPIADLSSPVPLPWLFLRFIGLCEVAGALGLILPGIFRIRRELTPLAAAGLVPIMAGATVLTFIGMSPALAIGPFILGCLAAFIASSRSRQLRRS